MNLIIAIVPVLSLIVLMAFFKMSGDKSSIISLVVTMLIAFFGFHFPLDDLLFTYFDYYPDGYIQLQRFA